MQLELFSEVTEPDASTHEHVYVMMTGPHIQNPVITTGSGSRWCWTCVSWVNEVGVSQDEAWRATTEELATRYALMVKAGEIGRHAAYQYMNSSKYTGGFGNAVLAIDIAIGEINAGKGN